MRHQARRNLPVSSEAHLGAFAFALAFAFAFEFALAWPSQVGGTGTLCPATLEPSHHTHIFMPTRTPPESPSLSGFPLDVDDSKRFSSLVLFNFIMMSQVLKLRNYF